MTGGAQLKEETDEGSDWEGAVVRGKSKEDNWGRKKAALMGGR